MKKSPIWILAGLLAVSALSARAGYYHPYHRTSVSWVVATRNNMDDDDRYVTLIGRVTRHADDGDYWFTDETGSVRLDAGDFRLPRGPLLMVGGRIDQAYLGFGHLEVDVKRWQYANASPQPPPFPPPGK